MIPSFYSKKNITEIYIYIYIYFFFFLHQHLRELQRLESIFYNSRDAKKEMILFLPVKKCVTAKIIGNTSIIFNL